MHKVCVECHSIQGLPNIVNCLSVYQLLAHGQWFSPGISASSTIKTDIAEILLKVALNTINQIKSTSRP
jgi:hypothetical protein